MTTYRKEYRDPHAALKAALAALLLSALVSKRAAILAFIADHGTAGLLDYADSILDSGWDQHFDAAAAILAAAAVDSTLETLDASGITYTDEFVANLEKHNDLLAHNQAASLLGLTYDATRDVALPTLAGWSIGQTLLDQLTTAVEKAETSAEVDSVIEDMSAFSAERAAQMAGNALTFVSGASARSTASATGAMLKRSLTVRDDRVCDDCNQDQADGWISVNDQFSGSETEDVPHHFGCRCSCEYQWLPILVPELEKAA